MNQEYPADARGKVLLKYFHRISSGRSWSFSGILLFEEIPADARGEILLEYFPSKSFPQTFALRFFWNTFCPTISSKRAWRDSFGLLQFQNFQRTFAEVVSQYSFSPRISTGLSRSRRLWSQEWSALVDARKIFNSSSLW